MTFDEWWKTNSEALTYDERHACQQVWQAARDDLLVHWLERVDHRIRLAVVELNEGRPACARELLLEILEGVE